MSSRNGNKPLAGRPEEFGSRFTQRIAEHPRIAYYLDDRCDPYGVLILMVIDELLVTKQALDNTQLRHHLDTNATLAGPVFDAMGEEIAVWRLKRAHGEKDIPDVVEAVWEARKFLPEDQAAHVGPNHVLIPASNYHTCPWGPPKRPDHEPSDLGEASGAVRVTVIDSGFVTGGPIDDRLQSARFGAWFTHTAAGNYAWMPEAEAPPGTNPLDQNGDNKLDALVGHANFVAGVVAQACPEATIDIVSHNGSFIEVDSDHIPDTPFATEASVARSLWETLDDHDAPADVINVGYAFPTLPSEPGGGIDGPPSPLFSAVLDAFADGPDFRLVAPAGNQNCMVPQYPAALGLAFDRVIGVGSILDGNNKSDFSNYGPWVRCCAKGEDVVSTFITWYGQTEEVDPNPPAGVAGVPVDEDFIGWAKWQGTSFAAPKVAGALARRRAAGMTLTEAWDDLTALAQSPANLQMGVCLDELLPE
jgi:hypothetical protein